MQLRMCVGACALLLLGLVLGATAGHNCVGDTYYNGHMCCHDCQPGNRMVRRCKGTMDSVCRPCNPGFYNEAVNYEDCKPCTHCNQKSGSEMKQNCTVTQDTVCQCRPGTQPLDGFKHGVDCKPCPPGSFSLGSNQACKPWTDCASAGKQTLKQGSSSSDAICEDRSPLVTLLWETQGPTARPTKARPTVAQSTTSRPIVAWARTSQGPFMPPPEAPREPVLAAILGLGLGLGLLVPLAALLVLYLYRRAWMPPGGASFRKPIQEEQADAHCTLAKI
ncbi:tumor necrosis factor receptor superfamily member 4 isoform X2 [Octodon degus]|uniref:Tumor necrosis factor receptor superfamily member 4 n=1 Tax=Octodon degus TaxID=10160 RepID=A0A6P6D4X3_OCTDE|nr:tumor necrosis factor receptor superfamily member 4 isoform X2 [Octodon degus]